MISDSPLLLLTLIQAYDRRKSMVTDNERQFYNMISKEYMSEESDSSDSESIVVHKHQWRSESKSTLYIDLYQHT